MSNEPKTTNEILAEQIRNIRTLRGLSQQELAREIAKVGELVPRGTIARTEAGERDVPLSQVIAFALALDVAPTSLFLPLNSSEPVALTRGKVASARQVRQWFRGQRPLSDGDPRRYFDVVADDDRRALEDVSLRYLLSRVQALVETWGEDDREGAANIVDEINAELDRMRASLERAR
jgi:transcriptional regulator with XRE-family HTH domain